MNLIRSLPGYDSEVYGTGKPSLQAEWRKSDLITPDELIPKPLEFVLRKGTPDTIAGWQALAPFADADAAEPVDGRRAKQLGVVGRRAYGSARRRRTLAGHAPNRRTGDHTVIQARCRLGWHGSPRTDRGVARSRLER